MHPDPIDVIAWDVDDVLNDFTHHWAEWAGIDLPPEREAAPSVEDWLLVTGLSPREYRSSLDAFRRSSYQRLEPRSEVFKWFKEDAPGEVVNVALTATPREFIPEVSAWVFRNFGDWLAGVLYSPSPRDTDPPHLRHRTKGDVLARLGGSSVLIDDSPDNLHTLKPQSHGVLFPRPWNGGDPCDPWASLSMFLGAQAASDRGSNDHGG